MTSRHRTTSSSRKDSYGLSGWRPSDSDSDRPRQTMTSTQRHNVEQTGAVDAPRKHRSSRRVDPVADLLDPSTSYTRTHRKSTSKDRSSTVPQSSYYAVPPSPSPSGQYQPHDTYYDLRAYLKKKTDKRSPRSHEKALAGDEPRTSRSGHHSSRHAYASTSANAQPSTTSQPFAQPSYTQPALEPPSSSRHHRDRDKVREKSSTRDANTRDATLEKPEDRERRKKKEREGEKERSSRDKERRKHRERDSQAAVDPRAVDVPSMYQATTTVQRSADKLPAPYPEYVRAPSTQPQASAYVPAANAVDATNAYQSYSQTATATRASVDRNVAYPEYTRAPSTQPQVNAAAMPWAGLTSAGRGAAAAPDAGYPHSSDREDPPLPIPPPGRRRERTSSKPHRSHHQKTSSQQAGQDSGISSSEQEHSVMERPRASDRHYSNREQASIVQRGYSSGPSGSENEKAPTVQKERRKHRTHGESSRHKPKSASADVAAGPTTSQEIASAWYQQYQQREPPTTRPVPQSGDLASQKVTTSAVPAHPSVQSSGKPTLSVGLTASQRHAPRIVSIRAGQGPADPHATLPKIHSGVTPNRQTEPLPVQYQQQQPSTRQQDAFLQSASHPVTPADAAFGYPAAHPAAGSTQYHAQAQIPTTLSRQQDTHNHHMGGATVNQQSVPEVVVRPPSAAPTAMDPYSTRTNGTLAQILSAPGQTNGRLQVPEYQSRARSTPAPTQTAAYPQPAAPQVTQPTAHSDYDQYRSTISAHAKTPSNDLPSRFPLNEDAATTRPVQQSSASPKRGLTYPGASAPAPVSTVHINPANYHTNASHDPRSPKPSVNTITQDSARLQSYQSASPAVVAHAGSAGSSVNTPKQSSSARLHSQRNGSSDTIVHAGQTKPSPNNSSQQQLPHHNSAINLQSHVPSRHDATTSRQLNVSSAYPEIIRYRSPAPGYPNAPATPAPNVASANYPQTYNAQPASTSYDGQYGRTTVTPAVAQPPNAQTHSRAGPSVDYGLRSPDPTSTSFEASTSVPARVPSRTAPSPAPTVRPPRLNTLASPSSKVPAPLHSAPPVPSRNQTYPTQVPTSATSTSFPSAHARTASDPQYAGRMAGGHYASASLPTRGHTSRNPPEPYPQADVLLTPSSLAPSMLPQTTPPVPLSRTTSKNTIKEKEGKKRGFFGISLFRSRSSPPKERPVDAPPPSAAVRDKRERKHSQPSQPSQVPVQQAQYNTVGARPATVAPQMVAADAVPVTAQPQYHRAPSTNAVPIAAPVPLAAVNGQRSPNGNGRMFTPFRLLSKRHRTVSTASVDAVDGTVITAMLTGGDSTRSSTAGRPSPPLRDPVMAAQEWMYNEETQQQGRGTLRRRRPGVTFDVGEEVPEEGRGPMQKSLRQNMQNMQNLQVTITQAPMPTRQATA